MEIKLFVNNPDIANKDKILSILLLFPNVPMQVKVIRDTAISLGVRGVKNWNISQLLISCKDCAIKLKDGWEISKKGIEYLSQFGICTISETAKEEELLRTYIKDIESDEIRQFLIEAVNSLENKMLRSAVVLSWVGAISILHEYTFKNKLTEFNNEAKSRFPKWKDATCIDDFSNMKEANFLEIIKALSIISKNVKDELDNCLKLRNGCGHPNSLKIGEKRVASHLEILILNIFQKFKL